MVTSARANTGSSSTWPLPSISRLVPGRTGCEQCGIRAGLCLCLRPAGGHGRGQHTIHALPDPSWAMALDKLFGILGLEPRRTASLGPWSLNYSAMGLATIALAGQLCNPVLQTLRTVTSSTTFTWLRAVGICWQSQLLYSASPADVVGREIFTAPAVVYNLVVWMYTLLVVATLGLHLLDWEEKLHSRGGCGPQALHWDN